MGLLIIIYEVFLMNYIAKIFATTIFAFAATGASLTQAATPDYILGTFFTSNEDTKMQCYFSEDGIRMAHWLEMKDIAGRDISCQYYNHSFYVCLVDNNGNNTFKIYRYKDLKDWQAPKSFSVIDRGDKYRNVWAPDLFIDDDGSAYVYFAKQKGYNSKNDERTFDIYVSKINDIEKMQEVNFEEAKPIKMLMDKKSDNYIDAQVRKVNGKYYMIVKNEAWITTNDNKSPVLLRSDTPDGNFVEVINWPLNAIRGYEGFSILTKGDKVYIYGDNYSRRYDNVNNSNHTVWIADKKNIENGPYTAHYVESDRDLRHGSVILIDDDYVKKNFDIAGFAEMHRMTSSYNDNQEPKTVILSKENFAVDSSSKDSDIVIDNFAPAINVIYELPKKKNVIINKILNPYGVNEIKFKLSEGSTLRIIQIDKDLVYDRQDKEIIFKIDEEGKITKE